MPKPDLQPPNGADHDPRHHLGLSDAAELAETLALLADWLSGSQKQTLTDSLEAFVGKAAVTAQIARAAMASTVWRLIAV